MAREPPRYFRWVEKIRFEGIIIDFVNSSPGHIQLSIAPLILILHRDASRSQQTTETYPNARCEIGSVFLLGDYRRTSREKFICCRRWWFLDNIIEITPDEKCPPQAYIREPAWRRIAFVLHLFIPASLRFSLDIAPILEYNVTIMSTSLRSIGFISLFDEDEDARGVKSSWGCDTESRQKSAPRGAIIVLPIASRCRFPSCPPIISWWVFNSRNEYLLL